MRKIAADDIKIFFIFVRQTKNVFGAVVIDVLWVDNNLHSSR